MFAFSVGGQRVHTEVIGTEAAKHGFYENENASAGTGNGPFYISAKAKLFGESMHATAYNKAVVCVVIFASSANFCNTHHALDDVTVTNVSETEKYITVMSAS